MSPYRLPLKALVVLLVVALMPLASAEASTAFGVALAPDEPDATPWVEPLSAVTICYLDDDGNNNYGAGESVLLHTEGGCSDTQGVVRLAQFQSGLAGAFVGGSDVDGRVAHVTFTTIPEVAYVDRDANGRVSTGDTLYVDTLNPGGDRVEVGDVRMTAYNDLAGGAKVASGDVDIGSTLSRVGELNELFGYADVDGNDRFSTGDHLYLKASGPTGASTMLGLNDLRMGGADPQAYGTWVRLGDADAAVMLQALPQSVVCYVSDDAAYDAGETVILRTAGTCAGLVMVGDQRLGSDDHRGEKVAAGDPEVGSDLHPLSARFMFTERNGVTGYGVGDEPYLDMTDSPNRVDHGDIRLMSVGGLPAATPVRDGDPDHGTQTAQLGTFSDFVGYADRDGNGVFDRSDLLYLNANGGGAEDVTVGDTRLGVGPDGFFFGSQVTTGSPDAVRRLTTIPLDVCVLDEDGDASYDNGEAVYLDQNGCGDLGSSAIRLVEVAGHGAGTRVGTSGEVGRSVFAPSVELAFSDVDLSARWSVQDTLYLHFDTASSTVTLGDVRLTSWNEETAGEPVGASDGDRSIGLVEISSAVSSRMHYYDANGDGSLSSGDPVYLDPALVSPQTASLGLVRLTLLTPMQAAPNLTASPSPTPSPTATASPSPTESETPPPEQTLTDSPGATGTDGDGDDPRTPGPGILLLLAAVASILWFSRRR